jgi:hypothetical protein
VQQNRGSGLYGTYLVQNVHVHNNNVDFTEGGGIGAAQDIGDNSIFFTRGNRFNNNVLTNPGPDSFWWINTQGPLALFQGAGQEIGPPSGRSR